MANCRCTPDQLCPQCGAELDRWHATVEQANPAPPRTWRGDRIAALTRQIAEAESWNAYADRMNAKAIAQGTVDAETIAARSAESRASLDQLRAKLAALLAEDAA